MRFFQGQSTRTQGLQDYPTGNPSAAHLKPEAHDGDGEHPMPYPHVVRARIRAEALRRSHQGRGLGPSEASPNTSSWR